MSKKRAGTTIIEVVMTAVLIAIVLLGISNFAARTIGNMMMLENKMTAISLANSQIHELQMLSYSDSLLNLSTNHAATTAVASMIPSGFTLTYSVGVVYARTNINPEYKMITVSCTYPAAALSGSVTETLSLCGYKWP